MRVAQKLPLILTFSPGGRRNTVASPLSFLRRQESPGTLRQWIPAFAGMTAKGMTAKGMTAEGLLRA